MAPVAPSVPAVVNTFHVVPSYINVMNMFATSASKSSASNSIVEPLRAIVKLFISKLWPLSAIFMKSPDEGVAGNVIVKAPPDVFAAILSLLTAVYVVVLTDQFCTLPAVPVAPLTPAGPVAPLLPTKPEAPLIPTPVAPVGPAEPEAPLAPAEPEAPCTPVAPA